MLSGEKSPVKTIISLNISPLPHRWLDTNCFPGSDGLKLYVKLVTDETFGKPMPNSKSNSTEVDETYCETDYY